MIKIGEVSKIEKDKAIISVSRDTACGENCANCRSTCTDKGHTIEIPDDGYSVGDLLELHIRDDNILLYSLIAYGIPLFIMISVVFLINDRYNGTNKEIIEAVSAVASLLISFYILKVIDKRITGCRSYIEEIIKIDR